MDIDLFITLLRLFLFSFAIDYKQKREVRSKPRVTIFILRSVSYGRNCLLRSLQLLLSSHGRHLKFVSSNMIREHR